MDKQLQNLHDLARAIKTVLRSDRDFVLCLSGSTGEGKSTLSLHVAQLVDENFSISNNITFSRQETIERIKTLPKYSCVVVDEAINLLFRRDFAKREQKDLLKLLDMCRDRNLCLIFNIPQAWSLDSHILNRVRCWIYVYKRGSALVFQPSENPFSRDPWNRALNELLVRKGQWRRSKNYVSSLRFNKVPKQTFEKYLKVKTEKKAKLETEPEEEILTENKLHSIVDLSITEAIYLMKKNHLIKPEDSTKLLEIIGISRQTMWARHKSESKTASRIKNYIYHPKTQ